MLSADSTNNQALMTNCQSEAFEETGGFVMIGPADSWMVGSTERLLILQGMRRQRLTDRESEELSHSAMCWHLSQSRCSRVYVCFTWHALHAGQQKWMRKKTCMDKAAEEREGGEKRDEGKARNFKKPGMMHETQTYDIPASIKNTRSILLIITTHGNTTTSRYTHTHRGQQKLFSN